ncbi:hypothetical protein K501DRAFT_333290 [Backusella circina FSU 941]|nr:hypothetical protein K501DRAFT_333290 [Backusella circina FSU 941]
MNLLYLLLSLSLIPFSYANYGPLGTISNMKIGAATAVFRIGRDIYSYGGDDSGIVSKYGIDTNRSLYAKTYHVKKLEYVCLFCFSFVISNDSVLTFSGYDGLGAPDEPTTIHNHMGVYYFNPVKSTVSSHSAYKMLPGNPIQRLYHQAVITPDQKSVYIFGGIEHTSNITLDLRIVQFDISSFTFTNRNRFTFVGGTATMLPSGIVVLAFGAFDIDKHDGEALYNTTSVFLYDTHKNELYKQNTSGTPPLPRASASGTLGPDNECIYYYGGDNFDLIATDWDNSLGLKYLRTRMRSDLVVLNTTSWTWFHPNISGPSIGARYEHFSLLYEDNNLIIGGGMKKLVSLNDFSVLKNLPTKNESSNLNLLQWFPESELGSPDQGDANNERLSAGAIAEIVICIFISVSFIGFFLLKKFEALRTVFWKKRLGEPVWTEILRTIIRFVLFGIFVVYISSSIISAINSPITNQDKIEEMKKMPVPDIRICSRFEEYDPEISTENAFTVVCDFGDGRDCSSYFHTVTNAILLPILDDGSRSRNCQVFIPPLDVYFHSDEDAKSSEPNTQLEIRVFKKNEANDIIMFYFTYYTSQSSPYRTLFGMRGDDSEMTLPEAENWIKAEQESTILKNTLDFDVNNFVTTTYSLTEARTLTNSSWNYFGFGNIYDLNIGVIPSQGPISAISISDDLTKPAFMMRLKPNEYSIRLTKEQKVATILGGLASAGGIFSVIMAIQTLLFGFRPDSPWGIVHRWSWGRQRITLRDQLREQFNPHSFPVPMATRVHDDYDVLSASSDVARLEMAPLKEGDDNQKHRLEIRNMEERIQMMEDLFKTYYINDEIFQKLNEARKESTSKDNMKKERAEGESVFAGVYQEDDEATIYQANQRRDSSFPP